MANIYEGQTALEIRLRLYEDLTNKIERALIKYRKPNGIEGFWTAEVVDWVEGVISYMMPTSSGGLDDEGWWTVWAYLYYLDGSVTSGDPIQIGVYRQGKNYIAFPYGKSTVGETTQMAQEAFEILYNNSGSGMTASNVQDAIDELDAKVDNFEMPAANAVQYDNSGSSLAATQVQAALDEVSGNIDEIALLISQVSKTFYVDKSRVDTYVEDGTIHRPYKTLAAAVAAAGVKSVIKVSSDTYTENIVLGGNVSLVGMGIGKTILTGTVTTGASGNCSLKEMTISNDVVVQCDTVVYDVYCTGNVAVSSNVKAYNFNIAASITHALAVTTGLVIMDNSIISTSANSPAVVQSGGSLVLENADIQNNSATNATVDSSGGAIRILEAYIKNAGGGLAADIDNGATALAPNVLTNVRHVGGISAGTSYTVQEGVEGGDPTGTNFSRRPATQIGYSNITSGLAATQVQAAIDEGLCSFGSGAPGAGPARAGLFYLDTVGSVLYIWNGTAWKYVNLT